MRAHGVDAMLPPTFVIHTWNSSNWATRTIGTKVIAATAASWSLRRRNASATSPAQRARQYSTSRRAGHRRGGRPGRASA